MQQLVEGEGHQQRRGDGADNDGQGLLTGFQHHAQVQSEAQQHHGGLQNFLGGKAHARLADRARRPEQGDDHTDHDGEYRPADDRHQLAQQPRGHGDGKAYCHAGKIFFDGLHIMATFLST